MTDQSSIFKDNQESGNTTPNTVDNKSTNANQDTELTDLLSGIKNERGEPKYKTLKDAIIGLQNAQTYIPDLKKTVSEKDAEIERLRAENERVANLEETVRKLAERSSGDAPSSKPALSVQEIAELVNTSLESTLTQREVKQKQEANIKTVVTSLKSAFGDTAETKFNEKATELGMTVQEFNTLAAKSPQIVLTALGITKTVTNQSVTPSKGTVNSEGFVPNPQSHIGKNTTSALTGASSKRVKEETEASKKMVEELHNSGKTVGDLTNPKEYAKFFGL
jgi:hypothetical protein